LLNNNTDNVWYYCHKLLYCFGGPSW